MQPQRYLCRKSKLASECAPLFTYLLTFLHLAVSNSYLIYTATLRTYLETWSWSLDRSRPLFLGLGLGLGLGLPGLGLGLGLGLSGLGLVLVSDSLVLITSLVTCESCRENQVAAGFL